MQSHYDSPEITVQLCDCLQGLLSMHPMQLQTVLIKCDVFSTCTTVIEKQWNSYRAVYPVARASPIADMRFFLYSLARCVHFGSPISYHRTLEPNEENTVHNRDVTESQQQQQQLNYLEARKRMIKFVVNCNLSLVPASSIFVPASVACSSSCCCHTES